ncbi:hypothetical protein GGI23_005471, partial [Coemansia sp. RSA 2559]
MLSLRYLEGVKLTNTSHVARKALLLTPPTHRVSALLQSRRWKETPPMPTQPAPQVDLESLMKNNPGVRVHNPLFQLEKNGDQVVMARKEAAALEIESLLKKYGATFPLSPVDLYGEERKKFLKLHNGIDKTITRCFHKIVDAGDTINLKHAFGDVAVFRKALHTGKMLQRETRMYPNEFMFTKPKTQTDYYLKHLTLYIHALHMLRETDKDTFRSYLDDFFLIIKAVRQRPPIHTKLVDMFEFKKLVLGYLLFDRQESLALTLAINLFTNVVPEMLDRWLVAGVIELYSFQEGDRRNTKILEAHRQAVKEFKESNREIEKLSRVKKRRANVTPGPVAIKEMRTEALVATIIEYYQSDSSIVMSAWEIIHLINVVKRRLGSQGLKVVIPFVLKYFYEYTPNMYCAENKTAFFYDWRIWMYKFEGFQLVMYYIKAFVDLKEYQMAYSVAETIESMPPKTIEGLVGNSCDIARAFKGLLVGGDEFPALRDAIFDGFGATYIKKSAEHAEWKPKYAKLRLMLAEQIVKFVKTSDDQSSDAATAMLGSMTHRMQSLTAMAIIRRLDSINMNLAVGWITRNFYSFDKEAQKSVFAWLTENLVKNRSGCVRFIGDYSFKSPMTVVRLVHLISRQLVKEADRRYILDEAQKHIFSTGNTKAIGSLLVTASQGPYMSAISSSDPQSPTSCARMVARFIKSIKPTANMDIPALVPYLFKVAQLLKSKRMELLLWREVLRYGVDVDQQILKLSLKMRLGMGDRNEDTLELLYHALRLKSDFEESSQEEQPQLAGEADSD